MIAIIEKDKVTLACSANVFCAKGFFDKDSLKAENAFCWKIPNDSDIIVGVSDTTAVADFLRYDSELVSGELTKENLEKNVIPKIKSVLLRFGKINKDGKSQSTFYFAQGNRCFEVDNYFCCVEIQESAETETEDSLVTSYCIHHKDETTEERLKKGYTLSLKYFFHNQFPIEFIDTESKTVKYILKAT